jgi:phospholipase C
VAAGVEGASLSTRAGDLIEAAAAQARSGSGSLRDIEHVVILMQENRSFDHYFGTLSGVRGFSDKLVSNRTRGVASSWSDPLWY